MAYHKLTETTEHGSSYYLSLWTGFVTPLRKELHWLPIEARPVFKILCYTYKAIRANLPEYMCDLVSVHNPMRFGLRSGNSSIKRLCTVKANSVKCEYMCYSLATSMEPATREHSVS